MVDQNVLPCPYDGTPLCIYVRRQTHAAIGVLHLIFPGLLPHFEELYAAGITVVHHPKSDLGETN